MSDSTDQSARNRGPRPDGRLAAVQFGYQVLSQQDGNDTDLATFWELRPARPKAQEFAETIIRGVLNKREELDQLIEPALENYSIERLSPVELSIMRCATWEMRFCPEPPPLPVIIDQAIEIALRLSGSEAARFVNGVLDRIAKSHDS